jgi:hypothetical protein
MTDVFRLLPPFQWRDRRYPLIARSVTFQHENAKSRIQYRDGEFVDMTGARGFTFSYTIPMREDIAKGPYKNLFVEGLPILLRDIRNRTPGELVDPLLGPFRCVPELFNDDSDPGRRDGDDVRVEFTHAPEFAQPDPEVKDNLKSLSGLIADAGKLDEELKITRDWRQEPSPEAMTDILSAINTVGQRGLRQVDKTSAYLNDISLRLEKIEDTADRAENPQNWGLRNDVRRMREAVTQLNKRATEPPTRKFRRITQNVATTVSAVAAQLDMTVAELLRLNPGIVKLPMIPVGTVLTATVAKNV